MLLILIESCVVLLFSSLWADTIKYAMPKVHRLNGSAVDHRGSAVHYLHKLPINCLSPPFHLHSHQLFYLDMHFGFFSSKCVYIV